MTRTSSVDGVELTLASPDARSPAHVAASAAASEFGKCEEEDGRMLEHGLQGFHGAAVDVPRAASLRARTEF